MEIRTIDYLTMVAALAARDEASGEEKPAGYYYTREGRQAVKEALAKRIGYGQ